MRIFDIKGFSVLKQSQKLNRGVGGVRVRVNMYYHAPDQNKPLPRGQSHGHPKTTQHSTHQIDHHHQITMEDTPCHE